MSLLQKFAMDAYSGRISKDKLRFGAPWRHPPCSNNHELCREWAKVQLMDFVQSLANAEFGVLYLFSYFHIYCLENRNITILLSW